MSTQLGIDKVQLLLPVSELSFEPEFPATLDIKALATTGECKGQRLLYTAGDREFHGLKAYLNNPNFNMTISPDRNGPGAVAIVHFSAGAYQPDNLEPLDYDQLREASHNVQNDLKSLGCSFDVEKAKITRLDIARNVELSHPVNCYSPAFSALNCRKRVDKKEYGGTGFLVGNKQWEINFYDKGAEMFEKGIELAACPQNTLRPEVRYLKSATVRDAVGADNLAELRAAWRDVKPAYVKSLKRDVFKAKMEAKAEATMDFHDEAEFVMKEGPERKWQAFKGEIGLLLLVQNMGLEGAKHFAANFLVKDPDSESGKRQIKRQNAELDRADYAIRMQESAPNGTLVKELYRELKAKTLDF